MVNLFINVYIYLGTRWHNHTGSMTEFWKYARLSALRQKSRGMTDRGAPTTKSCGNMWLG